MRRLRQRRRRGRAVAYVELDPIEIRKLVALGYPQRLMSLRVFTAISISTRSV